MKVDFFQGSYWKLCSIWGQGVHIFSTPKTRWVFFWRKKHRKILSFFYDNQVTKYIAYKDSHQMQHIFKWGEGPLGVGGGEREGTLLNFQ